MPVRISPSVAWQLIGSQAVLVDLEQGQTLSLNAVGSLIWSALAEDCGEEAITARLCGRFRVDPDTAKSDLRAFVLDLRSRRLVLDD